MKKYFIAILQSISFCLFLFTAISCDKDELSLDYEDVVTNSVSLPKFDKILTTTDTDGFSIHCCPKEILTF